MDAHSNLKNLLLCGLASTAIILSGQTTFASSFGSIQDDPPSDKLELVDDTEKKPIKVKPSILDKIKWEKKDNKTFLKRRKKNGIPEKLSLAPFDKLASDPTLESSDIAGYIENKGASDALLAAVYEIGTSIPSTLPDINILLSGSSTFSPSASSTGQIVVHAGAFNSLNTVDELLFLLGHELAHIAIDHFKHTENLNAAKKAASIAIFIANAKSGKQNSGGKELLGAYAFSDILLGPAWNRGDEGEADKLALDLIVRGGYSTDGAIFIMESLVKEEAMKESLRKARCGKQGGFFAQVLFSTPVSAECNVISRLFKGLLSSHPKAHKRLATIKDYIATRYPEYTAPASRPIPEGINGLADKKGAFLRAAYAQDAIAEFEKGNNALGNRYTALAYNADDVRSPGPRIAKYMQLKLFGEHETAIQELETIYDAGNGSRMVYLLLMNDWSQLALSINEQEKAQAFKDAALLEVAQSEKDPERFYKETLKAEEQADIARVEKENAPETYILPDLNFSDGAIAQYDQVLGLIEEAKTRFLGKTDEFIYQELEILRGLGREDDLYSTAQGCVKSPTKELSKHCKAIQKEIKNLRKKRKKNA